MPGFHRERVLGLRVPLPSPDLTPVSHIQLILSCILYIQTVTISIVLSESFPGLPSRLSNLKRGHVCDQVRQKCREPRDPTSVWHLQ